MGGGGGEGEAFKQGGLQLAFYGIHGTHEDTELWSRDSTYKHYILSGHLSPSPITMESWSMATHTYMHVNARLHL